MNTIQIPDGHWLNDKPGEIYTPEVQKALLKYKTEDEAILGGFNAQKSMGKPYKLPESLDKLDEKSREEFNGSLAKLRGVPSDIKELEDLDMAVGLPEGQEPDQNLAAQFKQFVLDSKTLSKADAQAGIKWLNTSAAEAQKRYLAQQEAEYLKQSEATNAELERPERLGSADNVAKTSELIKRMFMNLKGMTPEKHEAIAKYMVDTRSVHSADFIEALGQIAQQHAGEGDSHSGEGGSPAEKPETIEQQTAKESPATAKALGWT